MEQILTAVPYPVTGWGPSWGIVCPTHPAWMGGNVPTDHGRDSAEAFAEACACAHPDHQVTPGAPPQTAINAVIVAAMLDHAFDPRYADSAWFQWCDMTPTVHRVYQGPTDPQYCPDDVWVIDVQYSTRGGRALYGVNRDNVPNCYQD